jgi:hypothetical protein
LPVCSSHADQSERSSTTICRSWLKLGGIAILTLTLRLNGDSSSQGFHLGKDYFRGYRTCSTLKEPAGSARKRLASIPPAAITIKFSSGLVPPVLDPAQSPVSQRCCLWCRRTFMPRMTGGSSQKFCCTGHRQQFWIAARRWTMRAIEVGLLSVDCLKAPDASVHAA